MLVLQRYPWQSIWVGNNIQITILDNSNGITRVGIEAPREIRIPCDEIKDMDRHRFNGEVQSNLTEIPVGSQGIAFDRLDLDAWVDDHKHRSGRPAVSNRRSLEIWDENERQSSTSVGIPGTLTRKSSDVDFAKALALTNSKKPRST